MERIISAEEAALAWLKPFHLCHFITFPIRFPLDFHLKNKTKTSLVDSHEVDRSAHLEPAAKQSIKRSKNRYSGSQLSVDVGRRGLPIHTTTASPALRSLSLDPLC